MNKEWQDVRAFHEAFGHPAAGAPAMLTEARVKARGDWMREELDEFLAAGTLVEQADAMIDLIYFALGTMVEMGVAPDAPFDCVHAANMAKLWPDGRPRYREDGKTVKPPGWIDPGPRLAEIIEAQRYTKQT